MDFLFILSAGLALAFAVAAFFLYTRGIKAVLRARHLEERNVVLEQDYKILQQQALERERALADVNARLQEQEKKMLDRQEFLAMTKAGVMEVSQQVSSKLLEDHKREAEQAKKEAEAITKKINEPLLQQMAIIMEGMTSIRTQVVENSGKTSVLERALSSPSGAGKLAEVALENMLKNLGLTPGRDFTVQYAVSAGEGRGLRPDAVIYLPQNRVMVIDSKSSRLLLAMAEAEGTPREQEVMEQFRQTMKKHLDDLSRKDYRSAIEAEYKAAGKGDKISHVISVMLLPTEGALEKIQMIEPAFLDRVHKAGLTLASPISLFGLCSLASMEVINARKTENQERILGDIEKLMGGMSSMFKHMMDVGRNIKSAMDNFNEFAGSANRNVLPKLRRMEEVGLKPTGVGKKELPTHIPGYEVRATEALLIDVEADEAQDALSTLEDMRRKVS